MERCRVLWVGVTWDVVPDCCRTCERQPVGVGEVVCLAAAADPLTAVDDDDCHDGRERVWTTWAVD